MPKSKILLFANAIVVLAVLGGCASAGEGQTNAGRHDHQRDAKQGSAPSTAVLPAPSTRRSLRPAS